MNSTSSFTTVNADDLKSFTVSVFKAIGCNTSDADLASDVLIKADLRGIDSHGVARLSGYIRLYEAKRINTQPNITVSRERGSVFTIDGDSGLGLVVAPKAMQIALDKTAVHGSGFGAVKNSNHFGIAAFHAMMALEKNYIGMAMTNASPLVAPTYSKERMLGTNPICYAIPSGKYPPFILDMATSAAANGKLEIAERQNKPVPEGWLETKEGASTNDPKDLKAGGHLLPLGSDKDHGSHKGYGLGALVDILSGVLPGANFGPWVPPFVAFLPVLENLPGKGLGHFLGAMDVSGFEETETFLNRMDLWIDRFKSAAPANEDQKVMIPGEPEYFMEIGRQLKGIPIIDKVSEDLKQLAIKYHLDHPF
jgi:LDH2 family malate/lactate/ureidoglycolate dehydrogenase